MTDRPCGWCEGPIPAGARRDAETCSKRCRQARHRFRSTVGQASRVAGTPLRLAYADPPYPGLSAKYYGDHPDFAGEVDHAALVASLAAEYDGWALSTSAEALPAVLALCPPGVRVAAWVRGARPRRRVVRPLNAWEPVIYWGGRVGQDLRDVSPPGGLDASLRDPHDVSRSHASSTALRTDALVYGSRPRLTDPRRVVGAKPAAFCRWLFELLGALPGDELVDVFPGSGGVARAWDAYVAIDDDLSRVATDDASLVDERRLGS